MSNYQLVTITNELLEATAHDAGAFVDEAKYNMDTGFRNLSNDIAASLYGSGTGSRGTMGSITKSGSTTAVSITLSSPAMVTQFEVGMVLLSSLTDGSVPSTDTVTITGVNRPGGILTGVSSVSPANTLSGTWIAGNYLYQQGDIPSGGASGTGSYSKISGLAAWMPTSAASSSAFWGVDRSTDSRLQGIFYNGQGLPIEEALVNGSSLVAQEGGQPDMAFISFASYSALENSLGSKVQYVDVKHNEADIAFAGMRIHAPYGQITVIPDRSCPAATAYLLQMDTWKLRSLGKVPHVLKYGVEGLEGLRVSSSDALEIRLGMYGNLTCKAPGFNCVVQLSS